VLNVSIRGGSGQYSKLSAPAEAVPTIKEAIPKFEEAVPTINEAVPEFKEAVPTIREAVPARREAVPTIAEVVPTIKEAVPTIHEAYILDREPIFGWRRSDNPPVVGIQSPGDRSKLGNGGSRCVWITESADLFQ